MITLTKPPCKGVLDASGGPTTRRDYKKAFGAIKLLTENIMREPLNMWDESIICIGCLELITTAKYNYLCL